MSQTKIALDALDYAVTQFKQQKTLLQKALSSKSKNERNIRNKMTSLSEALESINKSHTLWVSKSGLSEEDLLTEKEKYNTSWLENLWGEVDDYQQQVDEIICNLNPPVDANENQELHVLTEQLDSLKLDISARVKMLLEKTAPSVTSLNSQSVKAYEDILKGVQSQLTDDLHNAFDSLTKLDPTNIRTHCNELEHFKRTVQPMVLTVQIQLAEQLATPPPPPPPIQTNITSSKGIEMEKSKAPTFSGKTIDYPEFK